MKAIVGVCWLQPLGGVLLVTPSPVCACLPCPPRLEFLTSTLDKPGMPYYAFVSFLYFLLPCTCSDYLSPEISSRLLCNSIMKRHIVIFLRIGTEHIM